METTIQIGLVGGAPLVQATFGAAKSFLVLAQLADGAIVQAHLADRGRLLTKLVPAAQLVLGHKPAEGRKTAYQVAGVYQANELVSLDTGLPNRLVEAALRAQALAPFAEYRHVEREVKLGASRFDFGLAPAPPTKAKRHGGECPWLVEVKSVGDAEHGLALFPDAPTVRGRRHLLELAELHEQGRRTAVIFIVQRGDAQRVAVNRHVDPAFAESLAAVAARGVEIYAYRCPLSLAGIRLAEQLPVEL